MSRSYTEEQLRAVVASSRTRQEIFRSLGLSSTGRGYKDTLRYIKALEIPLDHLVGRKFRLGASGARKPLQAILIYGTRTSSHDIRVRLLREGVKAAKCEGCGLEVWLGAPIPLELHHVDGDHKNSVLENLQVLCPNCHALTPNHAGKCNRQTPEQLATRPVRQCSCGQKISPRANQCKSCAARSSRTTKIEWPAPEVLLGMLEQQSCRAVAKVLGVSDVAVKKHMAHHKFEAEVMQ